MIKKFPKNSLLSIIYPYCPNICKNKPNECTNRTVIVNLFNTISTYNNRYLSEHDINGVYFTNFINNKLVLSRYFDGEHDTHYSLVSKTSLKMNCGGIELYEKINVDLKTNWSNTLNYKLDINGENVVNLINNRYEIGYENKYSNEVNQILNRIMYKLNKN